MSIAISLINSSRDTTPKTHKFATWEEFSAWFVHIRESKLAKGDLPGWLPCTFSSPVRDDAHASAITAAVFDLDDGLPENLESTLAGFAWCQAPTYSFFSPDPKHENKRGRAYRIAIQLAEPVPVSEWSRVWLYLSNEIGGADPACKNPSRFYYQPFASETAQGKIYEGEPLDWRLIPEPESIRDPLSHVYEPRTLEKCDKILRRAIQRIKGASPGTRNNTLNREVFQVGRVAHILGLEIVREELMLAAQSADEILPSVEAERTIDHALADGAEKPLYARNNWRAKLHLNGDVPKDCPANVLIAFEGELGGLLSFNRRSLQVFLNDEPPWRSSNYVYPREWTDNDSLYACIWLSSLNPPITSSSLQAHHAAKVLAETEDSYEPFMEYLDGLPAWDGQEWISATVDMFFDVGDDATLYQTFLKKWLMSAVARTYEPGCKADCMLVLVGDQGLGKSSFFRELVPDPGFYTGRIPRGDKDQLLALQGPVIVEDGELNAYGTVKIEAAKAFMSEQEDLFRPPYDRITSRHPRRCVLAGTTNRVSFLHDDTGGRRFWPIPVREKIDFGGIHEIRDMLWSEAVARYRAHEIWWLTDEEEALARDLQESYRERDPLEEKLQDRLDEKYTPSENLKIVAEQIDDDGRLTKVTISQAMRLVNAEPTDGSMTQRVVKALTALGWRYNGRRRVRGDRQSWYVRGPDS